MEPKYLLTEDALAEIEELRNELVHTPTLEGNQLTLDLSRLRVLDSMVLGQLVRLHLQLRQKGAELRLINLSAHNRQVIHHANLDSVFGLPIYDPPRWDPNKTGF